MKPRMLIALDLDDTLYLERDFVRSGFDAVEKALRGTAAGRDFAMQAWLLFESGKSRGRIFDATLAAMGITDPALVEKLVTIYRSHPPHIKLTLDAEAFLSRHPPETLALITNGPAMTQRNKIAALRLRDRIAMIIVTDELGEHGAKPSVRPFQIAQGGREANECVYIGDNPAVDFEGPRQLGWQQSIRVRRAGSLHVDVATPPDCEEIATLADVGIKLPGFDAAKKKV